MSRVTNTEAEKLVAEIDREAERIAGAVLRRAPIFLERITADLYEVLLSEAQNYLRENAAFNIKSEIASLTADRDSWRRAAERLEEEKRAAEARVTALEAEMARAVAGEREACAALLEKMARDRSEAMTGQWHTPDMNIAWRNGATAIRARQPLSRSSTEVKKDG